MTRGLDSRLMAAADMVREGVIAADIGTDHGYLIRHLVESGKCPGGYACDINPGPLEAARKNIAGLSDKISLLLGDGLDGLEGLGISDFVILGMGGDTIADIVTRHSWVRDDSLRFILQPMTKAPRLRRALYGAGFALEKETAVESGKFVYSVMRARYTGKATEISELFAWTGFVFDNKDDASMLYLSRAASRIQKKADGLLLSGDGSCEASRLSGLAAIIRERIGIHGIQG